MIKHLPAWAPWTSAGKFWVVLASFLLTCVSPVSVQAQEQSQPTERERLMAAMTVINMLLLSERQAPIDKPSGPSIELDLSNRFGPGSPVNVNDNFIVEFDLQDRGVEVCFFIDSNQLIRPGDLRIEVNGQSRAAFFGENCVRLTEPQQREVNFINLIVNRNGLSVSLTQIDLQPSNQSQLLLPRLTRGEWDEDAVRKVLKVFAFGGHATDEQIFIWASMAPADAIEEMLNFDEHNLKLSPLANNEPYATSASQNGKHWDWQNWMSSPGSNHPIPVDRRDQYGLDGYNFGGAYNRMVTVRGLNPFRQRIGFWETNYHLAVNLEVGVSRQEVAAYYDLIMEAHEAGLPYYQVMGVAAKSAAIASQYGHDRNQWRFDSELGEWFCACNEDFAREIHQLFYGIFGVDDPDNHENVTIPNSARMLTDMRINQADDNFNDVRVNFASGNHYNTNGGEPELVILGQNIPHSSRADQKIDYLMPISMQHPESLNNLPIMIIEGLADNNLNEGMRNQLRSSWASMGVDRVLLDFIHAYAISKLFHSPTQIRFLTSHERALYIANKYNFDNLEAYFGGAYYDGRAGRSVNDVIRDDGAGRFFEPLNNVFGGQSPLAAADSALAFENNYNELTEHTYALRTAVQCDQCDRGSSWQKRWQEVLPRRSDGQFYVADAARWIWNHVVGSMDNYTELERAQLYAILGATRNAPGQPFDQDNSVDFTLLMCMVNDYRREVTNPDLSLSNILNNVIHQHCTFFKPGPDGYDQDELNDINRVYTGQQIADDAVIQNLLQQLGEQTIPLESAGLSNSEDLRVHARERLNHAMGFVFTTPFVFAEGR